MRQLPLAGRRYPAWARLGVAVIAGLVALAAPTAALARPPARVPIGDEAAFCNGDVVDPVHGALPLDATCLVNLQIGWLPGMKEAFLEVSRDGGRSWEPVSAVPSFPPVAFGLLSGVGFGACDAGLTSGAYLLRALGTHSARGRDAVFSAAFPYAVRLAC